MMDLVNTHNVVVRLFFFQAEDGIRGRNVTGVQTCALPISLHKWIRQPDLLAGVAQLGGVLAGLSGAASVIDVGLTDPFMQRHLVDAEVLRDLRERDRKSVV